MQGEFAELFQAFGERYASTLCDIALRELSLPFLSSRTMLQKLYAIQLK